MASDESLTMVSCSILDEETDDGLQYERRESSLSRLSVCRSPLQEVEEGAKNEREVGIFMSDLSLEGAEADGEESEGGGSSDSEKEGGFYSLPETQRRRRKCKLGRRRRGKRNSDAGVKRWVRMDLGLESEHQRISLTPLSFSAETLTSSGGNSPIANWRISSPGDDPREVKARLKVWAQAVALASASRHAS